MNFHLVLMERQSVGHFFREKEVLEIQNSKSSCLQKALKQVLEKRHWNREKIKWFQGTQLKSALHFAYNNISFYRNKCKKVGFNPSHFRSLDDLSQIPLVTKEELKKADQESIKPENQSFPSHLLHTSGSTGVSLEVFRSEEALWYHTAYAMVLFHQWCRRKPIQNVLYILAPSENMLDYALADCLRTTVVEERIVSALLPPHYHLEKCREFLPQYISSYPGTMASLAVHILRKRLVFEDVKMIHLTSEMLDYKTKSLIKKAFPKARILETYTATEAGLVGYECPTDGGFHLLEDSLIGEIIERRLIVTDLINCATPIIRYSGMEDLCHWADEQCSCGSNFKRISHFEGRHADCITLKNGSLLSPYAVENMMEPLEEVCKYQIKQNTISEFEVLIVKNDFLSISDEEITKKIVSGFSQRLKEDVSCEVRFVDEIKPAEGEHKVPVVLSKVTRDDTDN